MKIKRILTNRRYLHDYFWQIVFEWEDCLSQQLKVPIINNHFASCHVRWLWVKLTGSEATVPTTSKLALAFVMRPFLMDDNIAGRKNIIPAIIDFWSQREADIKAFEERYRNNPVVLISSKQAFDFLLAKRVDVNLFHWPLSLPDKYKFQQCEKKYDCVLVGRPSLVLKDWMMHYSKTHPDFTYVYNDRVAGHDMLNYVTSKGEVLGNGFSSRLDFFELLRASKVGLYSTPSIDKDKQTFNGLDSNGYDQVTPRLFEYIAAGCHVLARYPENADTDYFNLRSIVPHIATYEEFESRLDFARNNPVDSQVYAEWLSHHYTSTRGRMLESMIAAL